MHNITNIMLKLHNTVVNFHNIRSSILGISRFLNSSQVFNIFENFENFISPWRQQHKKYKI